MDTFIGERALKLEGLIVFPFSALRCASDTHCFQWEVTMIVKTCLCNSACNVWECVLGSLCGCALSCPWHSACPSPSFTYPPWIYSHYPTHSKPQRAAHGLQLNLVCLHGKPYILPTWTRQCSGHWSPQWCSKREHFLMEGLGWRGHLPHNRVPVVGLGQIETAMPWGCLSGESWRNRQWWTLGTNLRNLATVWRDCWGCVQVPQFSFVCKCVCLHASFLFFFFICYVKGTTLIKHLTFS